MKPTVLLFDIDGTLITTGGVGKRALERVFDEAFGRGDVFREFRLDGMTDRAIVRAGLLAAGRPATGEEIDRVLAAYVEILEREVARADPREYRLHAGMQQAVDEARSHGHIALGLGTGNIREGARVKLTRVGIYHRFSFGGFGSDHEDRTELIRIGAERGAARLGVPLAECRVVVIGDTPKDVAAAKGIGAEAVGVATGHFSVEQLARAGADRAFRDLDERGAIRALIGA